MARPKTGKSPKVTFVLYPEGVRKLVESLTQPGGAPGGTIQELLIWMAWLLPRTLRQVEFSEAEAWLLCDALNGVLSVPGVRPPLEHEISDAISLDGLDRKYDVDGDTLVEKFRALNDVQALAVMLAVRQFWNAPNEERQLQRVGLVR